MWNPKFRYSMNGWLNVSSEWYLYRWIGEKTKKMIAGVMDKWMDKYWEQNSGRTHGRVDCWMHWETGACVYTESCMYRCIIIDTCINVRTSGEMQLLQMMMMMDKCVKRILCRNIFFGGICHFGTFSFDQWLSYIHEDGHECTLLHYSWKTVFQTWSSSITTFYPQMKAKQICCYVTSIPHFILRLVRTYKPDGSVCLLRSVFFVIY